MDVAYFDFYNSDGDIRIASKYLSDVQMVPELEEWILRNKVRGRH